MSVNPAQPVGSKPTTNAGRELWLLTPGGLTIHIPVDTFDEATKQERRTYKAIQADGSVMEDGLTTAGAKSWKYTTPAFQIPIGGAYSSSGSNITSGLIQGLRLLKAMKGKQSPLNNCNIVEVDPSDATCTAYNVDFVDMLNFKGDNAQEAIFDGTINACGGGTVLSSKSGSFTYGGVTYANGLVNPAD
jgi:hypothetical protein